MSTADQIISTAQTILAQCVVAANEASAAAAYVASIDAAPINSPAFTGIPTAPTAAMGTNTTQLATTAYLDRNLGVAGGIPTLDNTGHIPLGQIPSAALTGTFYQGLWNASTNSPTITSGVGTAGDYYIVGVAGTTTIDGISTWAVGDWIVFGPTTWKRVQIVYAPTVNIPLTSLAMIAAGTVLGNNTGGSSVPLALTALNIAAMLPKFDDGSAVTGLVNHPASALGKFLRDDNTWQDAPTPDLSAYATLLSPAFTGTPTAVTQAQDTNSTALATTQFVLSQLSDDNPIIDGTAAPGTSPRISRKDHVHPTDTSRAPLANPTLTGTPAAPTATIDTNTTQIATTAFVLGQGSVSGDGTPAMDGTAARGTSTHYARADHVHPTDTSRAPLNNPTLTGTPAAPTASPGTNTTQIATTAFVIANPGPRMHAIRNNFASQGAYASYLPTPIVGDTGIFISGADGVIGFYACTTAGTWI